MIALVGCDDRSLHNHPPPRFLTVGGTVTGLKGTVVLEDNGTAALAIGANGPFSFPQGVPFGGYYRIAVRTQPAQQTCSVTGAVGQVLVNITSVTVTCTDNPASTFTVSGTVSGLAGTVVLQNNGGDDLALDANGSFTFASVATLGDAYAVAVRRQPANQICTVAQGQGTVGANVTDVSVTCVTQAPSTAPAIALQADAEVHSVQLAWNDTGATSIDVYVSTQRGCDIADFGNCAGALVLHNVTGSMHQVTDLQNGQPYYFRVVGNHASGARSVSNEAGARPNALAFNDHVTGIAKSRDGSGKLYLAGGFTDVGITSGSAVPLDSTTGRPAIADFPMLVGATYALASDGAGGWYVGGSFRQTGNLQRQCALHILANGQLDEIWNPLPLCAPGGRGGITAIVHENGVVYLAGGIDVTDSAGVRHGGLVAAHAADSGDPTGKLIETWRPAVDATSSVHAIAASNGVVYAGGSLAVAGRTLGSDSLVAFDAVENGDHSGQLAVTWRPQIAANPGSFVQTLAVSGDVVYAGGFFTAVDSANVQHPGLAAFDGVSGGDRTGKVIATWKPVLNGVNGNPVFVGGTRLIGGVLYVGGAFTAVDAATGQHPNLAAIAPVDSGDHTGAVDATWRPAVDAGVTSVEATNDRVYAGGQFLNVAGDGESHRYLAAFQASGVGNGSGQVIPDWTPRINYVPSAIVASGNQLYVGGSFTGINSVARDSLAQVDGQGVLQNWNPQHGKIFPNAIATAGSSVYVAGLDQTPGQSPRGDLAAFDASSGTAIGGWHSTPDSVVRALAVSPDETTIYAGGDFSNIGSTARSGIAAFRAVDVGGDGAPTSWDPGALNGSVFALATVGDVVYAGGAFSRIGPVATSQLRNSAAALDAHTAAVTAWNPNPNNDVSVITPSPDGRLIYLGGEFSTVGNGTPRAGLVAVDAAGNGGVAAWTPARPTAPLAIASSDSQVYVVGGSAAGATTFTSFDAASGAVVAGWNALNVDFKGEAIVVSGTTVYVGGQFSIVGGKVRPFFTMLDAATGEVLE
jgi:hypothetical protein